MDNVYHSIVLRLILAISKALDKLEAGDAAAAEKILREAWWEASGIHSETLPLR